MPKGNNTKSEESTDYERLQTDQSQLSHAALRKERKKQSRARREQEAIQEVETIKKKSSLEKVSKADKDSNSNQTTTTTNEVEESQGSDYTVSIAVPGSIIDNAQSEVLKTYLAGQIARAGAIFKVSEIIVYDDNGGNSKRACEQMARVLQYLECPQYIRKAIFPIHDHLVNIGVVCPLDIPHHLRQHEILPFREGVVTTQPTRKAHNGSFVNIGLHRDIKVDKELRSGTRVTVELEDPHLVDPSKGKKGLKGKLVSPTTPWEKSGIYWGYSVRIASSLGSIFSECPFGSYDLKIGTSDKGTPVSDLKLGLTRPKHYLIVFGGVKGLEVALENDEALLEEDVSELFDHYLNTCPFQGSRTIRTEEAILISMTALAPFIPNTSN